MNKYLKRSLMKSSSQFKPGDVIACAGSCWQSDLINICTYGLPRYSASHVMIVGEDGLVFESTTECDLPCCITGKRFNGTQAHPIGPRLQSYRGKIWHYPLARKLHYFERESLSKFLRSEIGRPYDLSGGVECVGKLWSLTNSFLHKESLSALFCSEWVAAALKHIGRFETRNVSKWSPNRLVRTLRYRGTASRPVRVK